jgi:2-polyprenyl-3-methyl-5-hydroxy-6-metoxy-1,4-benzoquinol methylase
MKWGSSGVQELRFRLFNGTPTDWQIFHKLIADRLRLGMAILDVGCGKGSICPFPWNDYPNKYLVGLDPDETASENPYLDRLVTLRSPADHQKWPLEGRTFDLVIGRYVLEHVDSPSEFLDNVWRVLKPGAEFIFLTPNLLHPAILASWVLPHSVKQRTLRATKKELDIGDVFPTRYRLNTARDLEFHANKCALRVKQIEILQPQPVSYLDFSIPTFCLAYTYYQTVKWANLERWFGSCIVGVLQRGLTIGTEESDLNAHSVKP